VRHALQRCDLPAQPAGAGRLELGPVNVSDQIGGIRDEPRGIDRLLRLDPISQLLRAVEVLDELVDVLPDAKTQLQIAVDDVQRSPRRRLRCR